MDLLGHERDGSGADIVFLHGFGGNIDSLRPLAERLRRNFAVTLVEFWGHGASPHPDHPLTLDDYVEGLADIVRHYQMKSVTLVGHSFGGRVAVKFARCNGHLLDRLVLISAAGLKPKRSLRRRAKVIYFKLCRALGRKTPKNAGSADYRALKTDAERKTFVNIVNTHLDGMLPYITAPTMLIWGRDDRDTPLYMAKRFERRLFDASLRVLEGGHFFYAAQPEKVVGIIESFLAN